MFSSGKVVNMDIYSSRKSQRELSSLFVGNVFSDDESSEVCLLTVGSK